MKDIAYTQMYENELTHGWYLGTRSLMLEIVKKYINKNSKILDLGCGTGGTLIYFKNKGYKHIFGIDSSKIAVSYCKDRQLKNVYVRKINNTKFKANYFDLIICMDVLYHKGVNEQQTVNEMLRILKNGGIIFSQEPAYNWLRGNHDKIIETRKRFTKKTLSSLFFNSNFKLIKVSYYNLFLLIPEVIFRYISKFKTTNKDSSDVTKLPFILNNLIFYILKTENKLLNFINFPAGLSIISVWRK